MTVHWTQIVKTKWQRKRLIMMANCIVNRWFFWVPWYSWHPKCLMILIQIFILEVNSGLIYGLETSCLTKFNRKILQSITYRCLRYILSIKKQHIININFMEKAKQLPFTQKNAKRKRGWIGHTLRKPRENITWQDLDWNLQEKKKGKEEDREHHTEEQTWLRLRSLASLGPRWRRLAKIESIEDGSQQPFVQAGTKGNKSN